MATFRTILAKTRIGRKNVRQWADGTLAADCRPETAGRQSRAMSVVEATASTAIGFAVSLGVWRWVVRPLFGIEGNVGDDLAITMIFTIASILRGYGVRRLFEAARVRRGH